MDYLYSIILGIIQGITEYLPISSTGHLLVGTFLLGFPTSAFLASLGLPQTKEAATAFADSFSIFIQFGSVLAVVVYFLGDLLTQLRTVTKDPKVQRLWLSLIIAFIPAAIVGVIFRKTIKSVFYGVPVIGIALIVGGIIFLLVESRPRKETTTELGKITFLQALIVGIAQVLALIPGVSRSGATIVGGLLGGMDRPTVTKFTFYLTIPTLGGATVFDLISALREGGLNTASLPIFALGTVVAFLVSVAAIAWLLRYVSRHDFKAFGVYRIIAGIIILVLGLTVIK